MNLLQTIKAIEFIAAKQPTVGSVVRNDVFRLNAAPQVQYGAFAWLQGEHTTEADSSIITYNFTLFYVDRLTADKGNEIEVQSVGIETLTNILNALPALGLYPNGYTFRTFNQRFADECAGVFCNVAIEAAKDSLCAADYEALVGIGDFNLDFNEDFKCFEWVRADKTIYFI